MGAFKLQPDGSALYDLGDGTYIYTPPDVVDPATGKKVPGDQSQVSIVDKNGNPVAGKTNQDALAADTKYEGAGSNYGTTTPGSGGTISDPTKVAVSVLGGPVGLGAVALQAAGNNGQIPGVTDATNAIGDKIASKIDPPAPDLSGVKTASDNLGQFDPNAALPDQFKITTPVVNAPTIAAPPIVNAPPPATPPSLDFATGLTTPQITSTPTAGAIPVVNAPTLGPGMSISAGSAGGGSVTAQNIDPNAATATPVGDVSANGVGRDAETTALGQLNDIATGKTKTAADWLLQKGVDENVGAAYGLAASLQGRNPGVALRAGLGSAQTAIAKSAADIGAQKAQEQQQAMKDYATLGTSIAGQDLQAAMSNQSKDLQLSVTQMQAKIDILKANQASQLSAGEATLASQTAAQIATLQSQTAVATAQLQASTARDIANQTAQLDASKANAANQVATQIAELQAQVQIQTANLNAAVQTQDTQAQVDATKQVAVYQGQIQLLQQQQDQLYQAAKDNAANKITVDTTNATNTTNTSIATATLAEKAKADENDMDAKLKQLGLSALTAQLNAAIEAAKTDQQRQAAEDQFWASIAGTGGKVLAA